MVCDDAPPTPAMVSFNGSTNDIRELLIRELAALKDSDHILREMLAQARGVLWIAEPASDLVVYVSPAWSEIWGRPLSERPRTIEQHIATVHPDDRARMDVEAREALGGYRASEYRILRLDGTTRWIRDTIFALQASPGAPQRYAGFAEDVTAEKAAADAQARSDSLFRVVTENAHTMMILVDGDGVVRFATPASLPLLGYTLADTLGKSAADFVVPEDLPKVARTLQQCMMQPRTPVHVEARARHRDGTVKTVHLEGTSLLDEPAVRSIVVTMHDITELRAREEEVRESEKRLRTVLDSLHAFAGLLSPDGAVRMINRAAMDAVGITDEGALIGLPFADTPFWTDPPSRERLLAALDEARAGRATRFDVKHILPGDRTVIVDFSLAPALDAAGKVLYLVPAGIDVTAREDAAAALRQKEQELLQAQKMEAVGRLAGGVAHDFNNIITAVMAFSDMVLMDLPVDSTSRDDVAEIRNAADRAQALTRQLLAFSRHQVMEPRPFKLCVQVKGMLGMLKRLVGEDVFVSIVCDEEGSEVLADPGQIEQVVLNLAVNARDAMPQGGSLALSVAREPGIGSADRVCLRVRDTGCGMSAEVLKHVFEPFFTTKPLGQGTGLGLSTVYGIVKQSGGVVEIESAVGQGTTFLVGLPRFTGEAPPLEAATRPASVLRAPDETVLLVEDDDVVRAVARRVLERARFRVIEARNGVDGLEQLERFRSDIALVITDIVMPQMSGIEMLHQMRERGIHPAVLVTSGYTEETLVHHGAVPADARYLDKPFTGESLIEAARQALELRHQVHGAAEEVT